MPARRCCFARALHRLRQGEGGFGILEVVLAMGVMFTAMTMMAYMMGVTLADTALARQRQAATDLAARIIEQARGLSYAQVSQGNEDYDLDQTHKPPTFPVDANVVTCNVGGQKVLYFQSCSGEQIVHTNQNGNPPYRQPIFPYRYYGPVGNTV